MLGTSESSALRLGTQRIQLVMQICCSFFQGPLHKWNNKSMTKAAAGKLILLPLFLFLARQQNMVRKIEHSWQPIIYPPDPHSHSWSSQVMKINEFKTDGRLLPRSSFKAFREEGENNKISNSGLGKNGTRAERWRCPCEKEANHGFKGKSRWSTQE